jgi:hypothetical protein
MNSAIKDHCRRYILLSRVAVSIPVPYENTYMHILLHSILHDIHVYVQIIFKGAINESA